MRKRIVVVGSGYSGTLTTKKLAKKLGKYDVDITIIDKNPFHTMLTELHEIAAGRIDENGIKMDLDKIFAGRKVNVVLDTITEIDFSSQKVIGKQDSYEYDYLVISAGSKANYFGIPGAEEHAYSLWSYQAAAKLNERINQVFRTAQITKDVEERKKMLSFWVVGAGFSGVEMVSELAEYVDILCEKFKISRDEITLYNVDGSNRVVPNLSEKLSAVAQKKLEKLGIKLILCSRVECVGEDFIRVKTGEESKEYVAGTVIWTGGTQTESIVQNATEVLEGTRGRIQVDSTLKSVTHENVYIVGDDMYFVAEGEERPVPQMVENCEQSSHIAANNIAAVITGKGKIHEYKPKFHGVIVSIGSKDGVAKVGVGDKCINLSGFLAIAAKHMINIIYFLQVLGWNKIFHYLNDEVFTIRKNRSFLGGHFSNKTPSFLLVPLRILLGLTWIGIGINYNGMAVAFTQGSWVSGVEVAVGVGLLAGFFTTPAALISIILQIVFLANGESVKDAIWMIIASLSVLIGAGRILGIDYYFIPALRKVWKSIPVVKKWYLYHD